MRVLHLVKTSIGAGWALLQMRELVRLGVEVHVALPPGGPLVPQYHQYGIKTHFENFDLPVKSPWLLPILIRNLRKLVREIDPDLIHSHFVGTTLTMRLALGRGHPKKRIFQVPGPLHLENILFKTLDIKSSGEQDYWVASCKLTQDVYLKEGIAPKKVFLSYYGTDLTRFLHRQPGKLKLRPPFMKKRIVGMVALIYAPKWYLGQRRGIKGHEDLIDALKLLVPQFPDIIGVFVGGAWDKAHKYEKRVREYGHKVLKDKAIFLGTRNDVPDLYLDFDLAVHPSHSENVGGAVESFIMGVPTIATKVGGFPDIVIPGVTGWLVPPKSPAKLAEAILEALSEPVRAKEMALRGQELTRYLFDVRRTGREVYDIYNKIFADNI